MLVTGAEYRPDLVAAIERATRDIGGPVFVGVYDLNLFGVRSSVRTGDAFDDVIGIVCDVPRSAIPVTLAWPVQGSTVRTLWRWRATTDPGRSARLAPGPWGVTVLAAAHHAGLWTPGLHHGRPALVQAAAASWYNDTDRDADLDVFGDGAIQRGKVGINLHDAHDASSVGSWSEGCQVVQSPAAISAILALVGLQAAADLGSRVSYTLIDEVAAPGVGALLRGAS